MADFRKGVSYIKETAESKGKRKYTPNIYWKDGDIRTVAFVTPIADTPKVRLHQMVRIPDESRDTGIRYETLLCHKDPSMVEESGGQCSACDLGHDAKEVFVSLAIELEPIKDGTDTTGFNILTVEKTREDGTKVEYPQWGLIMQGAKNFFAYLAASNERKGDITKTAWEIQREGASKDTKYHFFKESAPLPDLSDVLEEMPSLEDLLEQMGSEEKFAELEGLEPGSQEPPWARSNSTPAPNGRQSREEAFARIRSQVSGD